MDRLSRSTVLHILSYLDEPQHILSLGLVCRSLHDITNDASVWEDMVLSSLETLSAASSSSHPLSPHRPPQLSTPNNNNNNNNDIIDNLPPAPVNMTSPISSDNMSMSTLNDEDEDSTASFSASRASAIRSAVRHARPVAESVLSGHHKTVGCVAIDRCIDNNTKMSGPGVAVSGSADGTVCLWRLSDNKPLHIWHKAHAARVGSVHVDAARGLVVSGAHDGSVLVHGWDPGTADNQQDQQDTVRVNARRIAELKGHRSRVRAVTLVGDDVHYGDNNNNNNNNNNTAWGVSSAVLTGSADRTLRVWDINTGEELALVTTQSAVCSLAVDRSRGDVLAVGAEDGTISLWTVQSASSSSSSFKSSKSISFPINITLIRTLFGHAAPVTALSFLPWSSNQNQQKQQQQQQQQHSAKLLSGSVDHSVRLWTTSSSARCIRTFRGHTGTVSAIIPAPSRSLHFLAAGHDRRIRIFNIRTGRPTASLRTPAAIRGAVAHPDLSTLIATGDGPRVLRWDFDPTAAAPSMPPSLDSLAVSRASGTGGGGAVPNRRAAAAPSSARGAGIGNGSIHHNADDDTSSISSYTSIGSVGSLSSVATAPDPRSGINSSNNNSSKQGQYRHRHRGHRYRPSIATSDDRLVDLSPGQRLYERGRQWESMRSGAVRDLAEDLHAEDQRRRVKKATPYKFTSPRDPDFVANVERDNRQRRERQQELRERLEQFRNPGQVEITRKAARLQREGSVFDRLYSDAKRKDQRR